MKSPTIKESSAAQFSLFSSFLTYWRPLWILERMIIQLSPLGNKAQLTSPDSDMGLKNFIENRYPIHTSKFQKSSREKNFIAKIQMKEP